MKLIIKFFKEVRDFSMVNWWIYIIYVLLLTIIVYTGNGDIKIILFTTLIHFTADIFIMMMFSAYSRKEYLEGTYFQISSMLIFLSIKIFTGLTGGGWHYLAADLIYVLAALKNWRLDVRKLDIKSINWITMSLLSLIIVLGVLTPLKLTGSIIILTTIAQWIQTTGIFLFAIALSTTGNERLRYFLSLIALTAMVGGSGWETFNSLSNASVKQNIGLALSYTLLPLTVLVFYINRWPSIIKRTSSNSTLNKRD